MKELRRKFYDQLLEWKDSKVKECLLIKGAIFDAKTLAAWACYRIAR